MSLPYPFTYLSTEALWPYQERVRACAAVAGAPDSPQMVLDRCVRSLRLFRDCDAPSIRDVRVLETHQDQLDFPCRDREQLIQHIVFRLDSYESALVALRAESRRKLEENLAFVVETRRIQHAFQLWSRYVGGHWHRHISPAERVKYRALTAGLAEMEKLFRAWHEHWHSLPGFEQVLRVETIGYLHEAFVLFGPSMERVSPVYSGRALHAAIYSVLEAFGLEKPDGIENGSRRVSYAVKRFRTRNASQGRQSG